MRQIVGIVIYFRIGHHGGWYTLGATFFRTSRVRYHDAVCHRPYSP